MCTNTYHDAWKTRHYVVFSFSNAHMIVFIFALCINKPFHFQYHLSTSIWG